MKTFISFELYVRDVAKTAKFFTSVFDAHVSYEVDDFAMLWFGKTRMILNRLDLAEFKAPNPILKNGALEYLGSGVEVVLSVEDLDTIRKRVEDYGAKELTPVLKQEWGLRDFRFLVSDGQYIRVTEADEAVKPAWD